MKIQKQRLKNLAFILTILLLVNITIAQDISGIYTNTTDIGPTHLILNQVDKTISVELNDGRTPIKLTGIIEDNNLILDTSEMPFTLTTTLEQDTLIMFFEAKNAEDDESLELSFKFNSAFPTTARAPQNILSQLLQFVPATQKVLETDLFYVNLWALSGFRDAATLQSQEDYLNSQYSEAYYAYARNLAMIMHLPFDATNFTRLSEEMPSTVGFSWFDIQASLSYGSSTSAKFPESGYVAYTQADQEPIKNALQELGFAQENFQEQDVWTLGEDGVLDPDLKNASNPFGGELGLSANVLLTENTIGYTTHNAALREQIRSYDSEIDSLAATPAFKFLVEQLEAENAVLAQAYFPPVDDFKLTGEMLDYFEERLTSKQEDLFTEISTFKSVLPAYQHLAISHYFEEGEEYKYSSATIHMLYDDMGDASRARAELFNRLKLYHQNSPSVMIHPARLVNSVDDNYFVVSVKIEDPNSALEERMSLAEPYNMWLSDIFSSSFLPIFYF